LQWISKIPEKLDEHELSERVTAAAMGRGGGMARQIKEIEFRW
jgi:hypothetical protein